MVTSIAIISSELSRHSPDETPTTISEKIQTRHHSTTITKRLSGNSYYSDEKKDGVNDDYGDDYDDKERYALNPTQLKLPSYSYKTIDIALALSYLCSIVAITTPIVLIPTISNSIIHTTTSSPSTPNLAATVASISTLGGAFGKIVNGFICQTIGGRSSARIYLLGLSLSLVLFSTSRTITGVVAAATGMEFFNSIMWTVCTATLASHYSGGDERSRADFNKAVTLLSLASTVGSLMTKVGFSVLLKVMSWRVVARIGGGSAIVGMLIVQVLVFDKKQKVMSQQQVEFTTAETIGGPLAGVYGTLRTVLGCGLFWRVGVAHAMAFLARSSDKVLGSFYSDTANLPRYLCGGLTSSVTLGFIHGLVTSRKFDSLPSPKHKSTFLKTRYTTTVISALVLSLCATPSISRTLGSTLIALLMALFSGTMASNVSFQFYHLPTTFAQNTFSEKDKAVCISFLDGMGFFVGWPIWTLTGRLVGSGGVPCLGMSGWSLAWLAIAGWFVLGGVVMMGAVPRIFMWEKRERKGKREACWVETV